MPIPSSNEPKFVPPVCTHHYSMLWQIATEGPLAAGEVRQAREWGAQATANKLRALVKLGLLARRDGIYELTYKGRAWLGVDL